MKLLLDTHLLLWAGETTGPLSDQAIDLIDDESNDLFFSVVSIWEVVIKDGLGKAGFNVNAGLLRRGLIDNGYTELDITSAHALQVGGLPPLHRDPFDRLLIAQATAEGITLLTADAQVAAYPGPIRLV